MSASSKCDSLCTEEAAHDRFESDSEVSLAAADEFIVLLDYSLSSLCRSFFRSFDMCLLLNLELVPVGVFYQSMERN